MKFMFKSVKRKIKRINVLFLLCVFFSINVQPHGKANLIKGKKSLIEILRFVSKSQKVYINFNPLEINHIYVDEMPVGKNSIKDLNKVLAINNLELKRISGPYLYIQPIRKFVLTGSVEDKDTKRPIPLVTIVVDEKNSVQTDSNGQFSFTLRKGKYSIVTKNNLYYLQTKNISLTASKKIKVELKKKQLKTELPVFPNIMEFYFPSINSSWTDSLLVITPDRLDLMQLSTPSLSRKSVDFVLKSNLLLWGVANPNLAIEKKIDNNFTIELMLSSSSLEYGSHKQFKYLLIQPEIRYWLSRSFSGSFFGFHTHYAIYDVGDKEYSLEKIKKLNNNRYKGHLFGAGFSYGYQWEINKHWNIETVMGIGYAHLSYDEYSNDCCKKKRRNSIYLTPTKASFSFVYLF